MIRTFARGIRTLLALLIIFALLAGLGWLIYTTVTSAPAVVAAVITGFIAILGLGVQRYFEQQREDERARRERMAPIYERLIEQVYLASEVEQPDMEAFFAELSQRLQLWGAPPVISAFNVWRKALPTEYREGDVAIGAFLAYEDLLLATRADLGVSNDGLAQADLLRIFINDIDDHLPSPA